MNRDQKAAVIEQIAADISESQAIIAIDYRGITVAQADALRARLRDANASFRVVKNSLTERAADQAGAEALKPLLAGPTALTFVRGDAAAATKAIADFTRTTQLLAFKGGIMDGAVLTSAEVTSISRLPSRDVLYGQLVGLIASPIAGLARTLNALIGGLAVGLGGVLEKKQLEAPAPAAAAPAAEPAAEAVAEPQASAEPAGETATEGETQPEAGAQAPPEPESEAEPSDEATAEPSDGGQAAAEDPPAGDLEAAGEAPTPGEGESAGELEGAGEPAPDPTTDDAAVPEAPDPAAENQKEN
jgi:large subunit ribosomal protein L10